MSHASEHIMACFAFQWVKSASSFECGHGSFSKSWSQACLWAGFCDHQTHISPLKQQNPSKCENQINKKSNSRPMWLCWTEVNHGILLKEVINPSILMFLWFREQLQCGKPPVGCLSVSDFHKPACIVAPRMVLSYFYKTCGSERGQTLTGKHDCTFLWPVSRYISLLPTSCSGGHLATGAQGAALLVFIGEQWKKQGNPGIAWETWWVYEMCVSEHHFSLSHGCFKCVTSALSEIKQCSQSALLCCSPAARLWQKCPAMVQQFGPCHWS